MVFKYTKQEEAEILLIEQEYYRKIEINSQEIEALDPKSEAYAKKIEERDNLEETRIKKISKIYDKAELRAFEKLGDDIPKILKEAKRQVPLILDEYIKSVREYNANKDTEKIISSREARVLIYHQLHLFTKALNSHPKEKAEIRRYISKFISQHPNIYIQGSNLEEEDNITPEVTQVAKKLQLDPIKTYGYMNDKVIHNLISIPPTYTDLNGQVTLQWATNQAGEKTKGEVPVFVALSYEGAMSTSQKLETYDFIVLGSIATLLSHHKTKNPEKPLFITAADIWRTPNGLANTNITPSKKQLEKIEKTMSKVRFTRCYMDITEELKQHYITIDDERVIAGKIDTYLLNASKGEFLTEKGRKIEGYIIHEEPILYTYNKAKDRVISIEYGLLDTSSIRKRTEYHEEFLMYFALEVTRYRNGVNRDNSKYLFETMYERLNIPAPEERIKPENYKNETSYLAEVRKEAKRDREKIYAILDNFKKKNYIYDYSPAMDGNKIIGVEIKAPRINPKKKQKKDTN